MKHQIKRLLNWAGIDIRRIRAGQLNEIGTDRRPIGEPRLFYEDIAARGFTPAGIIDVGANRGDWTKMVHAVFPSADFILIEPQVEMRKSLDTLCAGIEAEWIQAGAGREPGSLYLTVWDDLAGSSFRPSVDPGKIATGKQRETSVVTLDDVVTSRPGFSPDLVKLDIQGFEMEALEGASSLFGSTELFVIETALFPFLDDQTIASDLIVFLKEKGYEIYDVVEYMRRPSDGALGQFDLAFARRDGFLRQNAIWE